MASSVLSQKFVALAEPSGVRRLAAALAQQELAPALSH